MRKSILSIMLMVAILITGALPALAADKAIKIGMDNTITDVLTMHKGKKVEVVLNSGEKISGTVGLVSKRILHIRQLTGKEFYDAVIKIKTISTIIYRAK